MKFLQNTDPDGAWLSWSHAVEQWWHKWRPTEGQPRVGRGRYPTFRWVKPAAAHSTAVLPASLSLLRRVNALRHPGMAEGTRQATWERLAARLAPMGLLPAGTPLPDSASSLLGALYASLRRRVRCEQHTIQAAALNSWRERMNSSQDRRKGLFRWMKTEEQGERLSCMQLGEDRISSVERMDAVLQDTWGAVHRRRPEAPEPCFAAFLPCERIRLLWPILSWEPAP